MRCITTAALLLFVALPTERVAAQQTIDFNNTSGSSFSFFDGVTQTFSGGVPYAGFDFAGPPFAFGPGVLSVPGDRFPTLMHSSTPFALISGFFQSLFGVNNLVCVSGYKVTDHIPFAMQGCGSGFATYETTFFTNPGSQTSVTFNWADVTTLAFDSRGGRDPNDPNGFPNFNYQVDDLVVEAVVATPEPATLSLLATGLIGIAGAGRLRRRTQSV